MDFDVVVLKSVDYVRNAYFDFKPRLIAYLGWSIADFCLPIVDFDNMVFKIVDVVCIVSWMPDSLMMYFDVILLQIVDFVHTVDFDLNSGSIAYSEHCRLRILLPIVDFDVLVLRFV